MRANVNSQLLNLVPVYRKLCASQGLVPCRGCKHFETALSWAWDSHGTITGRVSCRRKLRVCRKSLKAAMVVVVVVPGAPIVAEQKSSFPVVTLRWPSSDLVKRWWWWWGEGMGDGWAVFLSCPQRSCSMWVRKLCVWTCNDGAERRRVCARR